MPFAPFVPPPSNTQPQPRQIEARGPHRGGISTFVFIIILAVLGTVIYIVTMHQGDVAQRELREDKVEVARIDAERPNSISLEEATALAHHVDVYKFTGTNNAGYFTVDPGKALCDTQVYESQDDAEYAVVACDIPINPSTNPLGASAVLLNVTVDWTNGNEPVRCDFYLGQSQHIAEVDC